ncbi:MAG: HIT family protein [Flavobacteriales bacterium]|nr:MAG: HIT family protein [Flavobacteriales bacterium]
MSSVFTKIIKGEIPSYKIAENENFLAFLDINPLKIGHTLIVPKIEEDYLFDLSDDTLQEMMLFSKRVAKAMKKCIPCNRIGVSVVGLEVPHAHIHLIPIDGISDMSFERPKLNIHNEKMKEIQRLITTNFI